MDILIEPGTLIRLQKALSAEVDRGFGDLQGRRCRFSEFLCQELEAISSAKPEPAPSCPWLVLAQGFACYSALDLPQRRSLVAETRNLLHSEKRRIETPVNLSGEVNASPSNLSLDQRLIHLPGIGAKRGEVLAKLGLQTVKDVLFYYPRNHIDYTKQAEIADLEAGETVTLVGEVLRCKLFTSPKNNNLTIFELWIKDDSEKIKLNRFYAGARYSSRSWQESFVNQYPRGAIVAASGLVKKNQYGLTLDRPEIEVLDGEGEGIRSLKIGRVLPIYPLADGVSADLIRNLVDTSMAVLPQLKEPFPTAFRETYGLMELQEAIANIHFPKDTDLLAQARKRLVFDEFFYLQLGFLQRRQQEKAQRKSAIFVPQGELIELFEKQLPFKLTNAQSRVVGEILEDLAKPTPMNRLVQGDVGAGKTIVAVFAILSALQSGYQAALMAPTEVLAEQHYRKLADWFKLLGLPVELLVGSTKTRRRSEILSNLKSGELRVLVGTHSLIEDPVQFRNLGLVVIDEQHRFGVHQRGKLLAKGEAPHALTLTATPIPRTLALTLHGDMDVSQVDELPPGRQPIDTRVVKGGDRRKAYELIRQEVSRGRQAYIIFPLVEESDKLKVKAAVEEHQRLSEKVFSEFNVGILHGRMKSEEKDLALSRFRKNEDQIIISTTVIEVGVDVPNATVILIENAERFGLSQLHQLRGRVGRGSHKSHCLLVTNSRNPDSQTRLKVLEQSTDGFFISEMDLRLRGPGEVLGTKQSGLPDFALASLTEDQDVLVVARRAAETLLMEDKSLGRHSLIQEELQLRYEQLLGANILT